MLQRALTIRLSGTPAAQCDAEPIIVVISSGRHGHHHTPLEPVVRLPRVTSPKLTQPLATAVPPSWLRRSKDQDEDLLASVPGHRRSGGILRAQSKNPR